MNSTNSKCIFTYITGDYDKLIEPSVITPGWDYICFTDNMALGGRDSAWEIRPIHEDHMEIECPKRRGNAVVMQYYKYISDHYDICMIVDGNIEIKTNLDEFLKGVGFNHDILIPSHPDRTCIYDEAKAIVRLKKDSKENVDSHIRSLLKLNYPKNYGLHATGLMVLRMNQKIKRLFDFWFETYSELPSKRDQMTFDYSRWLLNKGNIDITICPCGFYDVFRNKFPIKRHLK